MDNKKWISALVVAFIAGYFSNTLVNNNLRNVAHTPKENEINQKPQFIETQSQPENLQAETMAAPPKPLDKGEFSSLKALPVKEVMGRNKAQVAPGNSGHNIIGTTSTTDSDAEISDEEIDKIIPSPFNQSLKNHHGELRKKYKEYANTDIQDEWSVSMQNKISDFILSNPYSKFISLEFISCKANANYEFMKKIKALGAIYLQRWQCRIGGISVAAVRREMQLMVSRELQPGTFFSKKNNGRHIMKKIIFILACLFSFSATAQIDQPKEIQTSQKFGNYTVHYNVFNSKTVPTQIANTYKITRGRDIALINISLTKTENGVTSLGIPAKITGRAANLMQQMKTINFNEIKETDATYYLAEFRHTNEEDFRFEIKILPEDETKPLVVIFARRLFTEN